ncbi:hypothetical protein [Streptomyces sp. NPDC014806]|uniref:hypothetical protein n=1 Tax=Streptomyces sp. NPDC014806 TaxID=3364920 RepID=UPI0036FAA3FB
MNTRLVNTAAGVLAAAMQQGKALPANLAIALDSAQLLQSPETAAETARLRGELAKALEQTAAARVHVTELEENLRAVNAGWSVSRARVAELEQQLAVKDRPADEDPICYALTPKADAITRRIAPTQALHAEAGESA